MTSAPRLHLADRHRSSRNGQRVASTTSTRTRRSPFVYVLLVIVLAAGGCAPRRPPQRPYVPFAGPVRLWNGFDSYHLVVRGRHCTVVVPDQIAKGTPWIWNAAFFGERPEIDIALLERGFHVVYMNVLDLCGSPRAVAAWNDLYRLLTDEHGFARRVALEGISRGALPLYNWAAQNPEHVACIYADIPVCDFKSWPGGKGAGHGAPGEWEKCLAAYGFTDEEAMLYDGNPVDNLAPLADANIPLLHAYGETDSTAPFDENTGLLASRYRDLGGSITLFVKEDTGHVSGLLDPQPVIDFIREHTAPR